MRSLTQTAGRNGSPRQSVEFQCLRTAPAGSAGKRATGVPASEFVASRTGCVASVPGPRVRVASSVQSSCVEYPAAASQSSTALRSSLPGLRVVELVKLRRVEFAYPGCLARRVRPPGARSMPPLRAEVPRPPSNPRSVLRVAFQKLENSRRDKVLARMSRRISGCVREVASASVEFGSASGCVAFIASVECQSSSGASRSACSASQVEASVASRVSVGAVSTVGVQVHASGCVQSTAVASRRVELSRQFHGAPSRLQ